MERIIRKTLAEEVADRINEQIFKGNYKIGDKLPNESDMMKSFGVGRSTIREAIKLLANSSIIEVRHGIGCFVTELTESRESINVRLDRAEFRHLDEVRQWLEIKMVEKACQNRTKNDILMMKKALDKRIESASRGELDLCIDADLGFHSLIGAASKKSGTGRSIQATTKHLKSWYLNNYSDTVVMIETHQLHVELLEYIIQQNENKAVLVIGI